MALGCISRIPDHLRTQIRPVSKQWRDLVTASSFLRCRVRINAAEDLVQALREEGKATESTQTVATVAAGELKVGVTATCPLPPRSYQA